MPSPSKRIVLDTDLEVDRLCDQFEQEQSLGASPRIESYLGQAGTEVRAKLFEQLLALELEACEARPLLADYRQRFPSYETQIESVWQELGLLDWTDSKISRFRIVDELGRGGMGVVFLAEDPRLDRRVAIKLLTREHQSDSQWLHRFQQEARLASGLNHPNILTIYEIGEDQGVPFIASEYIDGTTLRASMAGERLSLDTCLEFATQISSGMAEAHRAGIIHRDLKADNVMVRSDGIVKILDFGLAQNQLLGQGPLIDKMNPIAGDSDSPSGKLTGTVHFMSPEQTRGQALTNASDVFSFGILLHLMLTSELPFSGSTVPEVIEQICTKELDSKTLQGESEQLRELVSRCLDKRPESRPDFETIRASLQAIRKGEQVHSASIEAPGANESNSELEPSEIRYAQSDEVNIAWQTIGEGPIDIVFVMGWVSHLDWFWKDPSFASFLRSIAKFSRVILFDKRGTGLSDRVPVQQLPDLETRMDDVRAVMEAAGSENAVLCGVSEGGPLCALFAATHPNTTSGLVMLGSYSRRLWAEDYPWGPTAEQRDGFLQLIRSNWGGPVGIEERAPSMANDPAFRDWWANYLRLGASPGAAVALTRMNAEIDVRPVLPTIQVPTLVVHRTDDRCLLLDEGKYLADQIPGAKFVELPGSDHLPFVGDRESIVDEIEQFVSRLSLSKTAVSPLVSIGCFKLLCGEPQHLVDQIKGSAVSIAERYRGWPGSLTSDSILFAFDGPLRSVQFALEVCEMAKEVGVPVQCGLATGPCQLDGQEIVGEAVEVAKNVAAQSASHEVWLTSTLMNLLSSEELEFTQVTTELCKVTRTADE